MTAWKYIRIVIFLVGFLFGLFFSRSGGSANVNSNLAIESVRIVGERTPTKSVDAYFAVARIKAEPLPAVVHF